jgi:hypothetical protein
MGVALTRGADYPDQATMESTAPSAGQYRVWSAGGCFRLGSAPAGKITVDLTNPVWRYASWPFTVDTATEQVTAATTGFVTGDPVNFHVTDTTGVLPAPLVAGTTYYARVISSGGGSTVLTLHPTSGDSVANTNVVNLTTAGTASFLGSRDNASTSIYALLWELWRLGTGNTTVGTNTLSNNITGGIYLKEQINLLDAMDMLADGCNAWYSAPAGALNLTVFEAPSGSAALDLAEADINKLVLRAAAGPTRGLPVHRVSVTYKKNWTVMRPAELAGGVTPAERTFAGLEFRTAVWNEPTGLVKALNAAAPELQVTSYMDSKGRADAEAARLGALHGVRRQTFEVEVEDTAAALAVGLGDVIRITHSAYSLSAALFRVIGLALDRAAGTITFTVWG